MKDLKITKGEIEGLIKDWEQFKTQNWYESDAVDVESYLRSEFAEIAARRLLYRMRDLLPPELLKQRDGFKKGFEAMIKQRDELREALINVMAIIKDCYLLLFDNEKPAVKQAEAAIKNTER